MSDDSEAIIKAAAEGAAEGFGKSIPPIYTDLAKPALQELGKGFAGIIKLALTPVSMTVWGYDRIADWLTSSLEMKLKNVPQEEIVSPPISIVGPSIEAIKFLDEENELRELFSQLIASSMTMATADKVHRSFVEIIKNISSDEAAILKHVYLRVHIACTRVFLNDNRGVELELDFLFSELSEIMDRYLERGGFNNITNLLRLGLIEFRDYELVDKNGYELFENTKLFKEIDKKESGISYIYRRKVFKLSSFGLDFCTSCITNN